MSSDRDLLLRSNILFLAELITVGWGKKETQFHGSEGKPTAADLKPKVLSLALMYWKKSLV